MAVFTCSLFSKMLIKDIRVTVTLPLPDYFDAVMPGGRKIPEPGEKYPVLWLLHGFASDESSWLRGSGIERYAQKRRIAVAMPDCGNSFYRNMADLPRYFDFLTQELPQLLQFTFPLSAKREDNFIAGMSMGGYGAFKAAFARPDLYAAAASLSGGLEPVTGKNHDETPEKMANSLTIPWRMRVFGENYREYEPEQEDLRNLVCRMISEGKPLPMLYMCCGRQDPFHGDNILFRDFLLQKGIDVKFEDGHGFHNFDFWDPFIRRVINWLPLRRN